jgi:monoterpene epsilon-lactone hydrolase
MTAEQKSQLDALLREGPLDIGGDVTVQREVLETMLGGIPIPEDVTVEPGRLGEIPVVNIGIEGLPAQTVMLYFHGGGFALGSAGTSVGLASDIARRAGARAVSVEYRLAPEHPYPAGIDDAVSAYQALLGSGVDPSTVAFAGESAGGGLVAATLRRLSEQGLPMPSCAVLLSPWVDLTCSGESFTSKAEVDPALYPQGMRTRAADYVGSNDASDPAISPVLGDLSGLPPLLIQSGSHEILLDDAVRLASRAAADDVEVTLQVWPGVPHVFQAFSVMLDEAHEALDAVGRFIVDHAPGGRSAGA